MNEACVQLLVRAYVPERLQPVAVVDVGVAPHHLAVDGFDVALEGFGKTGGFAKPFATGELRERGVERSGWEGLWRAVPWGRGAGSVGWSGHSGGVCGEDGRVVYFANDPFLHEVDVLDSGDLNGFLVVVQPGVCVSSER